MLGTDTWAHWPPPLRHPGKSSWIPCTEKSTMLDVYFLAPAHTSSPCLSFLAAESPTASNGAYHSSCHPCSSWAAPFLRNTPLRASRIFIYISTHSSQSNNIITAYSKEQMSTCCWTKWTGSRDCGVIINGYEQGRLRGQDEVSLF